MNASEVSVVIRDGETGNVMYDFAAFPTNVVIEVHATGSAAEPILAKSSSQG